MQYPKLLNWRRKDLCVIAEWNEAIYVCRTSATIPALLSTRKCVETPVKLYYPNTY